MNIFKTLLLLLLSSSIFNSKAMFHQYTQRVAVKNISSRFLSKAGSNQLLQRYSAFSRPSGGRRSTADLELEEKYGMWIAGATVGTCGAMFISFFAFGDAANDGGW